MIDRVISATEDINLGDASPDSISTWAIYIVSLSGTHSIVFKSRPTGSGLASGEWRQPAYTNMETGAVVAGGTAIAAEGYFTVKADGSELIVSATVTSNSFRLIAIPLRG